MLPVTDAVSVLDLRNFGNAVDFFGNSDADTIRDVWPDGLLSVSEMIQHPVPVSVPSLADTGQQDLVDYWQEQWFNLANLHRLLRTRRHPRVPRIRGTATAGDSSQR